MVKTATTTKEITKSQESGVNTGISAKGSVDIKKSKTEDQWSNTDKAVEKNSFQFKGPNVKVNMETSNLNQNSVLNQKVNAAFKIPVTGVWGVTGSTKIKIKTSHTVRIILGILALFITTGCILNYRIQHLENRNVALENQLSNLQNHIYCVMAKVAQIQQNVPMKNDPPSSNILCWADEDEESNNFDADNSKIEDLDDLPSNERVRRSVYNPIPAATSIPSSNLEMISHLNGSATILRSLPVIPMLPVSPSLQTPYNKQPSGRKRERGNQQNKQGKSWMLNKYSRLQELRKKDQANLAKLKLKLKTVREKAKATAKLAKALERQVLLASEPTFRNDARAAYLTVRDPSINIQNPEQLIGPWHIAESGKNMGFNDLWYQNLSLDDNGTSVVFQENGLYLIYAQVFYKNTLKKKEKPAPMGYRIYLKKSVNMSQKIFRKPIPIAECVPSFPTTYFQTCFTQICWFLEEGDEIYLEHFTDALPVIEAENMGQTFLGIVRLSQ